MILKQAGGMVSDINKSELNIFNHKCLVATNGKIHNKLLELIK
jgi:fructose-1,6-bisphosphatase/inositol monophosphatase family enzyme